MRTAALDRPTPRRMLVRQARPLVAIILALNCLAPKLYGGDAKPAPQSEAKEAKKAAPAASRTYVHKWISLPALVGPQVLTTNAMRAAAADAAESGDNPSDEPTLSVAPKRGVATVVVFIASWCDKCQLVIDHVQELARTFTPINTQFVYVFSHDTAQDAAGFAAARHMHGQMLRATDKILKDYNNPPLPSVYVGDRYGWLSARYLNASNDDLARLATFLQKITAY